MKIKQPSIYITLASALFLSTLFFISRRVFCDNNGDTLGYVVSVDEKVPEDMHPHNHYEHLNVVVFDRKHKNRPSAIAVAGENFHLFNEKGALIRSSAWTFYPYINDAQNIRAAKFVKDGYRDTLVVRVSLCDPFLEIFDNFGMHIGTIPFFNNRDNGEHFIGDINDDGVDEIIMSGKAFYTKDAGMTWSVLWENPELLEARVGDGDFKMQKVINSDFVYDGKKGIISFYFFPKEKTQLVLQDSRGQIIFKKPLPSSGRSYATSLDLEGSGTKNAILVIDEEDKKAIIFDKNGTMIDVFKLDSEIYKKDGRMSEANVGSIKTGKLIGSNNSESIVIGGTNGIMAYDVKGQELWRYPEHDDSDYPAPNLYITDLNDDGTNEVVVSMGSKILVLSNQGQLLDRITTNGRLSRDNMMDVADIDGDNYKEIIAVTSQGRLQVFKIK